MCHLHPFIQLLLHHQYFLLLEIRSEKSDVSDSSGKDASAATVIGINNPNPKTATDDSSTSKTKNQEKPNVITQDVFEAIQRRLQHTTSDAHITKSQIFVM